MNLLASSISPVLPDDRISCPVVEFVVTASGQLTKELGRADCPSHPGGFSVCLIDYDKNTNPGLAQVLPLAFAGISFGAHGQNVTVDVGIDFTNGKSVNVPGNHCVVTCTVLDRGVAGPIPKRVLGCMICKGFSPTAEKIEIVDHSDTIPIADFTDKLIPAFCDSVDLMGNPVGASILIELMDDLGNTIAQVNGVLGDPISLPIISGMYNLRINNNGVAPIVQIYSRYRLSF